MKDSHHRARYNPTEQTARPTRGRRVWRVVRRAADAGRGAATGQAGKDTATLDAFFDELGPDRATAVEAVSMDMGPAYAKASAPRATHPRQVICIDRFMRHEALLHRVEVKGLHHRPVAAGR